MAVFLYLILSPAPFSFRLSLFVSAPYFFLSLLSFSLLVSGRQRRWQKPANRLPARELCMVVRSQLLSWLTWTGWTKRWRGQELGRPPLNRQRRETNQMRPTEVQPPMAPINSSLNASSGCRGQLTANMSNIHGAKGASPVHSLSQGQP